MSKKNEPLVSIITVSFNSEKTIKETIESILNQTYNNIEYIVIDGKSTDKTVEIAEQYRESFQQRNITYNIISEKDNGIYDAMNKGIGISSGEIIGIINSDDYYVTDAVQKAVDFYTETNFDIMYADLRVFNNKKDFIKKSKPTKLFNTRYWNHPTTFVVRKVYDEQKYACENIYDDLNFMLSAKTKEYNIRILNEVLANFRLGGVSNKRSLKLTKQRIKLRNDIYKKNGYKGYKFNNFIMEFAKYILSNKENI